MEADNEIVEKPDMANIGGKDSLDQTVKKDSKVKLWLKRMGVGAFLFFLIKGLVWLAVFFGLFKFLS